MDSNIVIFEGYDGSGKTSLIEMLKNSFPNKKVRIVGRKNEKELKPISDLIEDESKGFSYDTELLLRIALEIERQKIIAKAKDNFDVVILDRGFVSLRSWVCHYDLDIEKYSCLFDSLEKLIEGSTVIFCSSTFDTCWNRINEKDEKSKKELLGKEKNREFHSQHSVVFDGLRNKNFTFLKVDTEEQEIEDSFDYIWNNLMTQNAFFKLANEKNS